MQALLEQATRRFVSETHLKNLLDGQWVDLHDEDGNVLPGIRGRMGAAGIREDGEEFGIDLIEMEPGSGFPLHVHPGDHLLYILEGKGYVVIDGEDRAVHPGDSIFIAAEHPHGVQTYSHSIYPFRFLAIGVPHKHVSATDRMTLVDPTHPHA